jgi:hypothetical protein
MKHGRATVGNAGTRGCLQRAKLPIHSTWSSFIEVYHGVKKQRLLFNATLKHPRVMLGPVRLSLAQKKYTVLLLVFRLGGGKFDHYSFTLQTVETCSKWGSYVLPFPQHIQHPLLFSALLAAEAALAKSRRTLGHAVVASPDSLTT